MNNPQIRTIVQCHACFSYVWFPDFSFHFLAAANYSADTKEVWTATSESPNGNTCESPHTSSKLQDVFSRFFFAVFQILSMLPLSFSACACHCWPSWRSLYTSVSNMSFVEEDRNFTDRIRSAKISLSSRACNTFSKTVWG
jgi:hypothetical protein